MNNKNLLAAMALGAALGIGGENAARSVFSSAAADSAHPTLHAVDLRRGQDINNHITTVTGYGWVAKPDGGVLDVGQAKHCNANPDVEKFMNSLRCEW